MSSYSDTLASEIKPMLAQSLRNPFDSDEFIFELKWDGIRAIASLENGALRLQSRNMRDITNQFPEIAQLADSINASAVILDGELVAFDSRGHPSLPRVQERLHRVIRIGQPEEIHFVVFDVLSLDGEWVEDRPLIERKQLIQRILPAEGRIQACEYIEGNGVAFYEATCEHDLEGIMAKRKDSRYSPGVRSDSWLKIKRMREADFVIGGYEFGGQSDLFSSLLVGLYSEDDRLVFVGKVGSGFRRRDFERIYHLLETRLAKRSPFANEPEITRMAHWCEPEIVCRVRYGEFTEQERLRYPTYLGLSGDKAPTDCRLEDAPGWPSR